MSKILGILEMSNFAIYVMHFDFRAFFGTLHMGLHAELPSLATVD